MTRIVTMSIDSNNTIPTPAIMTVTMARIVTKTMTMIFDSNNNDKNSDNNNKQ